MKKFLSAALLVTFVLAPFSAAFGQKSRTDEKRSLRRTSFASVSALADRFGVLVRWEMASEPNNVGFYVYRTDKGVSKLVNTAMVMGAASKAGADTRGGERYQIFDPQGRRGSSYIIESHSLEGVRSYSPQTAVKYVRDIEEYTGVAIGGLREAALSKNHNVESSLLVLDEELENNVTASQLSPDLATHRWVVSQPGARISVRREGMHRVSRAMLQGAGFPVDSDSTTWRLFMEGVEHPIIVGADNQYIEFYGKGIDTPESDSRVYYLIADTEAGKRIGGRFLRSFGGNIVAGNFPMKAVKKERNTYLNKILNGDAENYWGPVVTSALPVSVAFNLPAVDLSLPAARLTVKMQGFSMTQHDVLVRLNGNDIGSVTGAFQNNYSKEFEIPTSLLAEGNNTLQVSSVASSDFSLFDTVTVEYARKYQADQNRLSFTTPGFRRVNVGGFASANVRVFDTTFDGNPQQILNAQVEQNGSTYSAKLPAARPAVYYAVDDSALLAPVGVIGNNPSTLSSAANSADLVIISHSVPDFLAAAETWADYRRAEGFNVKVIDVRDIYDEFGYGVMSADSIHHFLRYAVDNWATAPQYVLLIGDGSFDPRNYEGFGFWSLVPTKMVTTLYGETGSDEALADFDDDGLAELSIGRIPARTAAQITTAFNKTTTFELPEKRTFDRGALFVYDLPISFDFEAMSQTLRNELPESMPVTMVDRGASGSANKLIDELNTGKYVVNYSGHGSSGVWANSNFFGITQVPQLNNADSASIFTMLTCLNGYFIRPDMESLGERLLNSTTGGSVVSWASTGETTPDIQMFMATRFFNQLSAGTMPRVGDLIRDSKQVIPGGSDVRFSWVLLGDPMLKVR